MEIFIKKIIFHTEKIEVDTTIKSEKEKTLIERKFFLRFKHGGANQDRLFITKTIAEWMKHNKEDNKKCPGLVLMGILNTDEKEFQRRVYHNYWYSTADEGRVGKKTVFILFQDDDLTEIVDIEFRKAFAKALFRKEGGKRSDSSYYWLGDYRKTEIEFGDDSVSTSKSKPYYYDQQTSFANFEVSYRRQARAYYQWIELPDYRIKQKSHINDLYIPQFILKFQKGNVRESIPIKIEDFYSKAFRAVILGNPGEGKSVLAQKICFDSNESKNIKCFGKTNVLSVLVLVREYSIAKREKYYSILQFIEKKCKSNLQITFPEGELHYLLECGRVVVVFDGLDEINEVIFRREISDAIEAFCTMYPETPVIVTSRIQGYYLVPLDENFFEIFKLNPFTPKQIEKYATNWFKRDRSLSPVQLQYKINTFLKESSSVASLRSNPFMLGLMCNVFFEKNSIPKNRVEILRQCSELFIEKRDKEKQIVINIPGKYIRPTTRYIAHWIYSDEKKQDGVNEKVLNSSIKDFLCNKFNEDRDNAELFAAECIQFFTDRSWILTYIGKTNEGSRLYQFTHRIFLEFYTAAHLLDKYPTTDKLGKFLISKIAKQEWGEVPDFTLQLLSIDNPEAAEKIVISMLDSGFKAKNHDKKIKLIIFVSLSLQYLTLHLETIQKLCFAYIDWCTKFVIDNIKIERTLKINDWKLASEVLMKTLKKILYTNEENRLYVANALKDYMSDIIKNGTPEEAFLAYETCSVFPQFFILEENKNLFRFWKNVSKKVIDSCMNRILQLSPKFSTVCYDAFKSGFIKIDDFVKWHGIEVLFSFQPTLFNENSFYTDSSTSWFCAFRQSPALLIIETLINKPNDSQTLQILESKEASRIANILLLEPTPWTYRSPYSRLIMIIYNDIEKDKNIRQISIKLNPDATFILFVFFGFILEATEESRSMYNFVNVLKNSTLSIHNLIRWQLVARFEKTNTALIKSEITKCGYNKKQQQLVWKWIRREIDFSRPATKEDKQMFIDFPFLSY